MKIVIVNGAAGCGKDTFVSFCRECLGDGDVMELSTITLVKSAMQVLGWDGEKTPAARRMMSDVKDAWTRFCDGPFNYILDRVADWQSLSPRAVFVHVREPAEIAKLADYYGDACTTVLIRRPGQDVPGNHADENVEAYAYDRVIENNGDLFALRSAAWMFCLDAMPEVPAACGARRKRGAVWPT